LNELLSKTFETYVVVGEFNRFDAATSALGGVKKFHGLFKNKYFFPPQAFDGKHFAVL